MDDIRIARLVRSRRRTISLIVTPEAELVVRAPLNVSAAAIRGFVRQHDSWIHKKMVEMMQRPQAVIHKYAEGEILWFLGRPYPLHISDEPKTTISRTDRLIVPHGIGPDFPAEIRRWYKTEAETEIRSRCMWFSMMTGYSPASLRITDARQRWGSCNHEGDLNFSWRLIQAPLPIVDYVIVHELVHLRQPDHSPKFWQKVEALMPDYRQRRDWLRANERLLMI
jgi:predicted metal-dependent hydrolase